MTNMQKQYESYYKEIIEYSDKVHELLDKFPIDLASQTARIKTSEMAMWTSIVFNNIKRRIELENSAKKEEEKPNIIVSEQI